MANFSPYIQTNASGSFNTTSGGFVQGLEMDDPSTRYRMRGGYLASDETLPMWGAVGIYENIAQSASPNPSTSQGGKVGRALTLTAQGTKQLTGFSVFTQDYAMVQTPQSPVPLAYAGQLVNLYPLGCLARIPVACDSSLVSLQGGLVSQLVSWDFVSQRLVPYSATYPQTTITGAVWASTGGGQTTFTVGTDLTSFINATDVIEVSGVVSTGGTGVGFNGGFVVLSITSTTIVVAQLAGSSPGTYSSGGIVLAGGGALAVTVLQVKAGNCMTVSYDSVTGFATWNRDGSCALIQLGKNP